MPDTSHRGLVSNADAMHTLLARFSELSQRMGHISAAMDTFQTRLGHLSELSARVSAAMMVLVGLPRVFRSDLHHLVAYGTGGMGGHGPRLPFSSQSGVPTPTSVEYR